MFLLIEVNSKFDIFEVFNTDLLQTLSKMTDYEGVHFILNGEVIHSSSLRKYEGDEVELKRIYASQNNCNK